MVVTSSLLPNAHLLNLFPIVKFFSQYKSRPNTKPSEVQRPQNFRPNRMGFPRMNCFPKIQSFIVIFIAISQKRKRRSAPFHVYYEMDTSENNFVEIITIPNPDNSGSDNSDSDADWDKEVTNITYRKACKTYTEDQAKLEGNHEFYWIDGKKKLSILSRITLC